MTGWVDPPEGYPSEDNLKQQWVFDRAADHETRLVEQDNALGKVEDWTVTASAHTAEQDATIGYLLRRLDAQDALIAELKAAIESDEPPDEEPPALPVPYLTHVNGMSPQEVERDMDAFGANGVFMYRPLEDNRLREHLDYFRRRGRDCWYQLAPGGWSEAGVRSVLDYATTDECRRMVWCNGQEMQHKIDPSQYAAHLAQQDALFDLVHEYGCLTGVHGEAWLVNPTNRDPKAGVENFRALLGDLDRLDVLAVSVMDWNQKDSGEAQLAYVIDALPDGFDKPLWVSSMCWTVPQSEPQESQRRANRGTAVANAHDAFARAGVTGYGWFNVSPWDRGTGPLECSVMADPLLSGAVAPFARSL